MHRQVSSSSKRRRRRTEDKLDLDELMTAPNLGGMLSFLEVPAEEARRRQALRQAIDRGEPTGAQKPPLQAVNTTMVEAPTVGSAAQLPTTFVHRPDSAQPEAITTEMVTPTKVVAPTVAYTIPSTPDREVLPYRQPDEKSPITTYKPSEVVHPTEGVIAIADAPPVVDNATVALKAPAIYSQSVDGRTIRTSPPTEVIPPTVGYTTPPTPDRQVLPYCQPDEESPITSDKPSEVIQPAERVTTTMAGTPSELDTPALLLQAPAGVSAGAAYAGAHRRERIFRATLVQHGHSPTEQILYQTMWNHGSSLPDGSRQLTAGYRELGYMTNLNDKTVKYNLQSLERKLAIRVTAAEHTATRTGRTYQVFSYEQILPRRSQAGLVWVRKTKGVEFISIPGVQSPPLIVSPTVVGRPSKPTINPPSDRPQGAATTVPDETPVTGDTSTTEPVGSHTTQLGSVLGNLRNTRTTTTTSAVYPSEPPLELVKAISRIFPAIDHQAVETLWKECRLRAGDCTVEEVLYFAADKLPIARNGKIQNPVGFILTSVPRCFEGDTFANFREAQARARREREESERKREEQERLVAEACQRAEEKFTSLSNEEYKALYERIKLPLLAGSAAAKRWDKQTLDDTIRRRILQELQDRELGRLV